MAKIIGIGGVSRSGKSSLARRIQDAFPEKASTILEMDQYVHPVEKIPTVSGIPDWEHPDSVDFERLIAAINQAENHSEIILVEGILVFANPELLKRFDLTISLLITRAEFLKRRREETRWGDEPEWYLDHVWDSFIKFGQHSGCDLHFQTDQSISEVEFNSTINSLNK